MNATHSIAGGRRIFITALVLAVVSIAAIAGLVPGDEVDGAALATNASAEVGTGPAASANAATDDGSIRVILAYR